MIEKLDNFRDSDPKAYWKLLKELKDSKIDTSSSISMEEWKCHFMDLNKRDSKTISDELITNKTKCFNELDFKVTEKEISLAIKSLKNNKSVGLDLVSNEMIRYSQHIMLPILKKAFNTILSAKKYPSSWCQGYITPIYKNGDVNNPNNYRGISIFSCIGKLFNSIINNRIESFITKYDLIDHRQIGFKRKSRTADHIFILRSLIEKYNKNNKSLFVCFVDFRKAFDKVNHTYLLHKLHNFGLSSNLLDLFEDMYMTQKFKLSVKVDQYLSDTFASEIGVRQGDPLSPNLFKIFINDLMEYVDLKEKAPSLNDIHISHLAYADDLVLLATNQSDLQKSVYGIQKYCEEWGLSVNTDKTKVVVFSKSKKHPDTKIKFQNHILETVNNYKYLGLEFHADGKFDFARNDLTERANKAMFKLLSAFKNTRPSYKTSIHLYDRIVKPILLYGSEVCGYKVGKYKSYWNEFAKDVFEKCQLRFLRSILGVHKRCPIVGIYGDTGRLPIIIEGIDNMIKYWFRLKECTAKDELLYNAYKYNKQSNSLWWKTITKITTDTVGILSENTHLLTLRKSIKERYTKHFISSWQNELFNDNRKNFGNKLRTYRTFKKNFGTEAYLLKNKNVIDRTNISRLRLSCHKLQIEIGRYNKGKNRTPPEERLCTVCTNRKCEDEYHFIMECDLYKNKRGELFNTIHKLYPNFNEIDNYNKFRFIMGCDNEEIIHKLGKFISANFKIRSEAINNI